MTSVQAIVHRGAWNAKSRKHTVLKMIEGVMRGYETDRLLAKWTAADASLQNSDGSEILGLESVSTAVNGIYERFASFYHEPQLTVCIKVDDGFNTLCQLKIYASLLSAPAAGASKVRDNSGKEWDVAIPGCYYNVITYDDKAANGLGMTFKRVEFMGGC
ncbi:MAG: hypothetical protein M1839_004036 [Geoglossum umbratile]|nr:MAG: hypothetical protein M1839_004036 [Geoglossum umbratile]